VLHLILILTEKYKLSNFSLCKFSHYPVTITSFSLKRLFKLYLKQRVHSYNTILKRQIKIICRYYIRLERVEFSNAAKLFTAAELNLLTFRVNARQQYNAKCLLTFPAAVQGTLDSRTPHHSYQKFMATFCFHI
jgi:hypothetical protein